MNHVQNRFAGMFLILVGVTAVYLWITGGWLHVELLPVTGHVRSRGWLSVFDWKLFDGSPDRIRPLSDLVEVADATLRPHTVWLFDHHPSLTLSSVLMAVLSAAFFYGALRSFGHSRNSALVITALLISTIGFLSCFVPYIRPAKRLALLGTCMVLFLIGRYIAAPSRTVFASLCSAIILSFAADETGFVLWPVAALFLWPYIRGLRLVTFAFLPVIFFVLVKVLLPPIYDVFGTSGPRDGVLGASIITKLLSNLLSPDFYMLALNDLASSLSVSIGILAPWEWMILSALVAMLYIAVVKREWIVVASLLAVVGASIFLSMIDMANGPGNYLAQLTYYYHSALAPLVVFLIASIYNWIQPAAVLRSAFALAAIIVSAFNLMNFQRVNELTKIVHTYPLATLEPTTFDERGLQARFEHLIVSGSLPQANGYRSQFAYYREHPMGDESYARNLLRAFRPQ